MRSRPGGLRVKLSTIHVQTCLPTNKFARFTVPLEIALVDYSTGREQRRRIEIKSGGKRLKIKLDILFFQWRRQQNYIG